MVLCSFGLKIELCSCDVGISGVAFYITIDEQLQSKRGCHFPHASTAVLPKDLYKYNK